MLLDNKQKEIALVKDIINTCLLITKQLKLYGSPNKQIDLATSRLQGFLESYLLYHEDLNLTVARHGFIYDEEFIDRSNTTSIGFAYMLFQHGISSITFHQDISPDNIHTFLILTSRPPSETWEEGGIVTSLHMRGIDSISVREMSESDIAFINNIEVQDRDVLLKEKSPLWDRFAFAVHRGLKSHTGTSEEDEDDTSPDKLAEMTNQILARMALGSQQEFSKGLSNFLATIQFEKVNLYRKRALAKLTAFISKVSPEIRERLFSNIISLKMKPSFTEEFFSGLSDEVLIELLESSAKDSNYAPPVIMKVLAKIAQDKDLDVKHIKQFDKTLAEKRNDIAKLFKKDDFEKYVPEQYRNALLNIIQNDDIPKQTDANLLDLKKSLEDTQQEKHTADIILKILSESPDKNYLKGLGENLTNIVYLYLEEGSYRELNDLCNLSQKQDSYLEDFERFRQILSSNIFIGKVLTGINRYGRSRFDDIETLVVNIGTPFIVPLLGLLATEENRTNRLFYLKLLQQFDSKLVINAAVKHLNDSRWFYIRNIIHTLRKIQDPEAIPYIKPLLKHPHPKVRSEAIRACLYYGCEDAIEKLLKMLDDKDQKTVDTAISLALMTRNAEVSGRLVALLRRNSVFNYRLDQKKTIVKALAEIAPKGSLPFFFELLSTKNTLHSQQHKQLNLEILKVLERYDSTLLAPVIQKYLTSVNEDIRVRLKMIQQKMES